MLPYTLTDEQKSIIASAARTRIFTDNPVPDSFAREFDYNLLNFVHVTYISKLHLADIYPSGADIEAMLQADWAESLEIGAIRMFDDTKVNFVLHELMPNGTPVEVTIQRNRKTTGLPWYMSRVPEIINRRQYSQTYAKPYSQANAQPYPGSARSYINSPYGQVAAQAAAGTNDYPLFPQTANVFGNKSAAAQQPKIVRKLTNESALIDLKDTSDYRLGAVPEEIEGLLNELTENFTSFVHIPTTYLNKISMYCPENTDVYKLLDNDWSFAAENNILRYYDGKVIFPISAVRDDGSTPVEVAIKNLHPGTDEYGNEIKPWTLTYVNTYVNSKTVTAKTLEDWAYLGDKFEFFRELEEIAVPELWSPDGNAAGDGFDAESVPILENYLTCTFNRLFREGKICESDELNFAAFNTGLVARKTYEPIYACFETEEQNDSGEEDSAQLAESETVQKWSFAGFTQAGHGEQGRKLVRAFNPLPSKAVYATKPEDIFFNMNRPFEIDTENIISNNIFLLPQSLIEEESRGNDLIAELIYEAYNETDSIKQSLSFRQLRNAIIDDDKIFRRLKHRIEDSAEIARRLVDWDYKNAIPAFLPDKNIMVFLFPLMLSEESVPDNALVVELSESGAYIAQTVLGMETAYNYARIVFPIKNSWLTYVPDYDRSYYPYSDNSYSEGEA